MKNDSQKQVSDDSLTPLAKRFLWVESADKVRLAVFILSGLCAVLFILDFVVHRHAYAPYENTPGFYALTGFLAFSFIVLGASALRWLIARPEDYYSPNNVDAEEYPEDGLSREVFEANESGERSSKGSSKGSGKKSGRGA